MQAVAVNRHHYEWQLMEDGVSARGKAVSKESLLTQVWGNEIVEENNLQAQISAIRRILGHDRHLLVTEFGCGYRFNINKSPTEPLSKSKIPEPAITHLRK